MGKKPRINGAQIQAAIETAETVHRLVAIMAASRYRLGIERARRTLSSMPREEVIPALINALRKADDRTTFGRTARLLAALEDDAGVEELMLQSCSHPRYRVTALTALAQCDHPLAFSALVDALNHGTMKMRRACAGAMARTGLGRMVGPLCRAAANESDRFSRDAVNALRKMGRAQVLAARVLADPILDMMERAQSLEAIERVMRFDSLKYLSRESRRREPERRSMAVETAKVLRERRFLLRAAESVPDLALLRPASGVPSDESRLLHPSDYAPDEATRLGIRARIRKWLHGRSADDRETAR